ncbi:PIH1 domain-containing protein 2 [Schistosoma haematobium]|uniref:PIH1 domain-containing protein 2 n=1 Tax=Schistosoma haematobium TaxID=6185 RepID=A0A922LYZ9_SCHHA|nr:PIH1 domain-containing protein 2 [Schistosoma haematobium]KAH9596353.1 PIH1 domain-containing protein 2 [Schistosoma haematobium]
MSNNKILDNANRLWKMLDEMSENDPVCYQKFINRQMESFHKTISPPIIRFVVKLTQKNRVKLEVMDSSVGFHPLDLLLPCKIETDLAEAKFNSKKEKLIILVPIISSS